MLGFLFFTVRFSKLGLTSKLPIEKYAFRFVIYFSFITILYAAFNSSYDHVKTALNSHYWVIVFLPFLNAVFDFISIGTTRFLLRNAVLENFWIARGILSLIDAIVAIVLLISLGCLIIFGVQSITWLAGNPLIDLKTIFDDIAAHPGSYLWIYLILFSTLLPTILHFILWWTSLAFNRINPLNKLIAYWINRREITDDALYSMYIIFFLTVQITFFTSMAIIGIVQTSTYIVTYYPAFGYYFLWFFEWFAYSIGAAVEPTSVETRLLMDV